MTPPARRLRWPGQMRPTADRSGGSPAWRRWLALGVALLVLNAALTFHNVWPTWWVTTRHELSIDMAGLLLLLAIYSERVRVPARRFMSGLALVWLILAIGRYAEVTAPALYGRPVNLYWDAPHVLNVAMLLSDAAAPSRVALVALGVLVLLGLVVGLLRWSLLQVRAALDIRPMRRALLAVSAVLVGLYAAGHVPQPLPTTGWFSLPVSRTYWQQAAFALEAYRQARNTDGTLCAESPVAYDLSALGGTDVVVMFIESYGATTYDRPDIAGVVGPSRQAFERAVTASGRQVVSAFVESPTFGGGSWLAHMSFLAGRSVRDQGTYGLLLTQDCDVLTKAFARDGYRVVGVMPGLKQAWPEGAFYDFDEIYGERALAYSGPDFGWWRIPDQFALAKIDALELGAESRSPLFVVFPTVNSHTPFRPTPPYQPDWGRVLTEHAFDADAVAASLAVEPEWTNLGRDYADTMAYVFEYLGGYLRERRNFDGVLIVMGDHQPPAMVSGEAARWDVPVHVITRNGALLESLSRAGFVSGTEPAAKPIGPMHELTRVLFGGGPARVTPNEERAADSGSDATRIDIAGVGLRRQPGDEPSGFGGIEPVRLE